MGSNELHLLRYIYLSRFFGVTSTFRVYLKIGTFTLKYIFSEKNDTFTSLLCATLLSLLYLNAIQVIPNTSPTFLWEMSDAHSQMIHSLTLFKGLIKQ